jgi:hypothetical protein
MKRGLVVTVTEVHLQVVAAPRLVGVEGGDGVVRSVEGVEGKEAHAKSGISGRSWAEEGAGCCGPLPRQHVQVAP